MAFFNRVFPFLFLIILLAGCRDKKKTSLSGEETVGVGDFIDFFPDIKLPYQLSDTSLLKKDKDSLLISYKVFGQFVPDSVSKQLFGKGIKPKIYPLGKAKGDNKANYLFAKSVAGSTRTAFVLVFDKDNQLLDGMQLLHTAPSANLQYQAMADKNYSITKVAIRKNSDGTISDGRDVYGLDKETGKFALIMTDPLEDKPAELINPIDTFSRKLKYTADYGSGKMNLVSIRDGRKKGTFTFFIHFEKNNGSCIGELKGDAVMKSATTAEYREAGESCALQFTFSSSAVILKELEPCGSRRGLRCSFNGSYPRKKEAKPKTAKK